MVTVSPQVSFLALGLSPKGLSVCLSLLASQNLET